MNVWNLEIAFVGSPPSDENWERAEAIVAGLRQRVPDWRVGERAGALWMLEYGMTEDTVDQAIADVKRTLIGIDGDAPELLRVGRASR